MGVVKTDKIDMIRNYANGSEMIGVNVKCHVGFYWTPVFTWYLRWDTSWFGKSLLPTLGYIKPRG